MKAGRTRRIVLLAVLVAAGCQNFRRVYDDCFEREVCLEDGQKRLGPPSAKVSALTVDRPTSVIADGADEAKVTVTVRDADGNGLPNITVTLAASGDGAVLTQPGPTDATGAAIGRLMSTRVGTKVVTATITSTSEPVAIEQSPTVRFDPGPPARLVFLLQPSAVAAGDPMSPVMVEVVDALGNRATSATHAVALSLVSTPAGATLLGSATANAVGGIATFSNLAFNKPGDCVLSASALGVSGGTSQSFTVTLGRPASLAFLSAPPTVAAGETLPQLRVALLDAQGNTLTSTEAPVSLTLVGGDGALQGTTVVTSVSGVAAFDGLSVRRAGTGYVIAASAGGGFASELSVPFSVTAGAVHPTRSKAVIQPAVLRADGVEAATITVAAFDEFFNAVPEAQVTLSIPGTGHVLTQPGDTNSTGVTTGTLRSTDIGPAQLTVQISVASTPVTLAPVGVLFTVPPPVVRLGHAYVGTITLLTSIKPPICEVGWSAPFELPLAAVGGSLRSPPASRAPISTVMASRTWRCWMMTRISFAPITAWGTDGSSPPASIPSAKGHSKSCREIRRRRRAGPRSVHRRPDDAVRGWQLRTLRRPFRWHVPLLARAPLQRPVRPRRGRGLQW